MADKAPNGNSGERPVTMSGIKAWLPLLLTIATLLIALGVSKATLDQINVRSANNEASIKAQNEIVITLRERLARMETDISYIRIAVDKLDDR